MDWRSHFLRQTDYQLWANQALFDSLARLEPEALRLPQGPHSPSIVQAAALLLLALRLWARVLRGEGTAAGDGAFRNPHWHGLKQRLQHELRGFRHWLAARPEAWFEETVSYPRPGGGEVRSDWVRDLLTHLMNLCAHYRAHIAAVAVRLGAPVAQMDYLCFVWAMQRVAEEAQQARHPPAPRPAPGVPPGALVFGLSFTAPGVEAISRTPILLPLDAGGLSSLPPWGPWPGARGGAGVPPANDLSRAER
jgi:uncharacterized damage-inducible protein DinB